MSVAPGRALFDRQVACLEATDIEKLMDNYNDDAVIISFDFVVRGKDAIRTHFGNYLQHLGGLKLKSTDKFVETEDSVYFEATVVTAHAEVKVYDVFMLRDGRIFRHFTGVLSVAPFAQQ